MVAWVVLLAGIVMVGAGLTIVDEETTEQLELHEPLGIDATF